MRMPTAPALVAALVQRFSNSEMKRLLVKGAFSILEEEELGVLSNLL